MYRLADIYALLEVIYTDLSSTSPGVHLSHRVDFPVAVATYAWKAALGVFPGVKSAGKLPMLVCMGKLLELLAGCDTALRLTAHAKVFTSVVLKPLGDVRHLLHPVHNTSTVQCVAFLLEPSVVSLASL